MFSDAYWRPAGCAGSGSRKEVSHDAARVSLLACAFQAVGSLAEERWRTPIWASSLGHTRGSSWAETDRIGVGSFHLLLL